MRPHPNRLIQMTAFIFLLLASPFSRSDGADAVRIVLPTPHSMPITGIARLEGLGVVASAGMDGWVKVWDEQSGLLVSEFASTGYAPIAGLASDPSSPARVAIATLDEKENPLSIMGGNATIKIVDLATGQTDVHFHGQAGRLRFSPTGRWLTSSANTLVSVWDTLTGRLHLTLQVDAECVDFTEANTLVYRRKDRLVRLDLESGASTILATGSEGRFAVSHDGALIADTGDKELRVWRVVDGVALARYPLLSSADFIYFAQDGSVVAGGHAFSMPRGSSRNIIYRVKPGEGPLESFTVGHSPISMIADGGDSILVGQKNGLVQRVFVAEPIHRSSLGVDADDISAVAFSANGRYLAAGFSGGGAAVWEPTSNWYRVLDPLKRVRTPPEPAFSDVETQVRYSSTYISGEGITDSIEFDKERVLGLAFLGPETLLISHQSGAVEKVNITNGEILSRFDIKEPLAVITGRLDRAAILAMHSVTFVDNDDTIRNVPIPPIGAQSAAFNVAGDRLVIFGLEGTLELDAQTGAEVAHGEMQMGVPVYTTDGSLQRMTMKSISDDSKVTDYEESPQAYAWLTAANLGVSTSASGQARIWSKVDQRYVAQNLSIGAAINSVAISQDSRTVAFGSAHGKLLLYRTQDGKHLADLVTLDRRGWLARDEYGGFDGSYAAWDELRATMAETPLVAMEPANFFAGAYRPQLIAQAMKVSDSEMLSTRIEARQLEPPTVRITAPVANYVRGASLPSSTTVQLLGDTRTNDKGEQISWALIEPNEANSELQGRQLAQSPSTLFEAEVRSKGDGIGECRVFRNRRLMQAITPENARDGVARIKATLPLLEGDNVLSAYCFSASGLRSTEAEVRIFGAPSLRSARNAYVFVIGVNSYSPEKFKLAFAVPDAMLARNKLESALRASGQYDSVTSAALLDQNASSSEIIKGLEILAGSHEPVETGPLAGLRRSAPSDAVFIYFAGHGGGFAGDYRLVAANATVGTGIIDGTVSADQIRSALEPLQADRTVIIIDACESGQALDQVDARAGPLAGRSLAQLAYDKAMFILSASQSSQAARELQRLGHGVFSYVLFERGLSAQADENQDGFITVREWLAFAQSETPKELDSGLERLSSKPWSNRSEFADEFLNRGQTPRVFIPDPDLAREFVIVRSSRMNP